MTVINSSDIVQEYTEAVNTHQYIPFVNSIRKTIDKACEGYISEAELDALNIALNLYSDMSIKLGIHLANHAKRIG